jgi:hypothetical protein
MIHEVRECANECMRTLEPHQHSAKRIIIALKLDCDTRLI